MFYLWRDKLGEILLRLFLGLGAFAAVAFIQRIPLVGEVVFYVATAAACWIVGGWLVARLRTGE